MSEMPDTVVVTDIDEARLYRGVGLPMWVLYDHPTDLPDYYVLRLWDGTINQPTKFIQVYRNMGEVEQDIEASHRGFYRLERFAEDDPKIVCTFL